MTDENHVPPMTKATASSTNGEGIGLFSVLNKLKQNCDGISEIKPAFPAWTNARDSIDYCLSTYMYWAILFNSASLWHSGINIVPKKNTANSGIEQSMKNQDPFRNSLWRYLKSNLHGMVELDYLFRASDAQSESFGLLGFLNPLDTLIEDNSNKEDVPRKYEAGILLYYKERLIRRLFTPFPAPAELLDRFGRGKYPKSHFQGKPIFMFPCTGVIQVPEWLLPNASRDDFVSARSPMFDTFVYNIKKLVAQYLAVCLDDTTRKNWIHARGEHFLKEVGRNKPLTPLLHLALFKSVSNKHFHTLKGHQNKDDLMTSLQQMSEMGVETEGAGTQSPDETAS